MKTATLIVTVMLSAIAVLHVLRLVFQVEVSIGGSVVPMWASAVAVVVFAVMAVWLWREQRR